jgi:hypothetical protein
MDLWQMISSEHANIEELCQEVLEATPHGPNSRTELFADLEDELDRLLTAKQNVLYAAFSKDGRTETYVHELDEEYRDIRRRLDALSDNPDKNGRQWAGEFKEFTRVIHHAFSLEENGAMAAARNVLSPRQADALRQAYEREEIAYYESSRWHMPQAMMPSRYGMPTGVTFGILAGVIAVGGAALAWSLSKGGQATRTNRPLRPARRHPQAPFPLQSGVVDRSLSRRGMEGRASSGSMERSGGMGTTGASRPMGSSGNAAATGSGAGSDEQWFSSANPPHAPSGLSTPLQPGGTTPGASPAASTGSVGTGGGQTENRDTGAPKGPGR